MTFHNTGISYQGCKPRAYAKEQLPFWLLVQALQTLQDLLRGDSLISVAKILSNGIQGSYTMAALFSF